MRIISTFNQSLFENSGRHLIESIRAHLSCELLIYTEDLPPIEGATCLDVTKVPEFELVRRAHSDVIGEGDKPPRVKLEGFNKRWFNWFRKIVAEYDAMVRQPYAGITLFLDSDIRITRAFDDRVARQWLTRPVGIFRGTREAVETGMIFYDGAHLETRNFVTNYMNLFLSGEFRKFPRWDDSYTMSVCADRYPHLVCDFAAGQEPVEHVNSNGHRTDGHVLPLTPWGDYMEHDKGIHWRKGIAATVHVHSSQPKRKPWYKRLFKRIAQPHKFLR